MSKRNLEQVPLGEGQPRRAFIDAVLAGEEIWTALDDWVERWHEAGGAGVELHEWLGLTWEEYQVLGAGDERLAAVLYSRRRHVPLEEALDWFKREPVAARGTGDAKALQALLRREGLVGA